MKHNPLLQVLEIIKYLGHYGPSSAGSLMAYHDLSEATLKRHLAEARVLGADIRSSRSKGYWLYELRNSEAVSARVALWIDLEKSRNLLEPVALTAPALVV